MASLDLKLEEFSEADLNTTLKSKATTLLSSVKSKIGSTNTCPPYKDAGTTAYTDSKVFVILRDFLQPQSTTTVKSTVEAILDLLPANAPLSNEVCGFGEVCLELAEQIPYHHPSQIKLACVLEHACRSHKLTEGTAFPNGMLSPPARFVETMLDTWPGPDDENPAALPNLNAFFARMHEKHIYPSYPSFPIWAMRNAFEIIHKEGTSEGMMDQYILAAAQWILWDGQDLLNQVLCPANQVVDEDGAPRFVTGPLYDGKPGLSLHRWHFWRDGFKAAANDSGHNDECRNVSRKAVCLMDSLEQAMMF